jgi:nucleoside-diphosphate-sugar epimerase
LWQSAFADDVGVGFAYACGRAKCFGEAYNITGDKVVTWDEYTKNTAAAIGAPEPKIVHVPTDFLLAAAPGRYGPLEEIFRYHGVYSTEKINRDVPEFKNRTPYAEAVRQTVAWMDKMGRVGNSDQETAEDEIVKAWEGFGESVRGKWKA